MSKKYLIVLIGQGDEDVRVVNEETWHWINSKRPSEASSWEEIAPVSMHKVRITCGSYDNDRALQCEGQHFSSLKDAMDWARDEDVHFTDTYTGCIY